MTNHYQKEIRYIFQFQRLIRESFQLALMASNHVLIISAILYLARGIICKVSTEKIMDNLTTLTNFYVYILRISNGTNGRGQGK